MARKLLMTWNQKRKGWLKNYRGRIYNVSCRQLGTEPTKEASWLAANAWWEKKRDELDHDPDAERRRQDQGATAFRVWSFVQDFDNLDEDTRAAFVDSILGNGAYAQIRAGQELAADKLLNAATDPDRTVKAQVERWGKTLQAAVAGGQISEGRYDAYLRHANIFAEWIGQAAPVEAIDADKLSDFYLELCNRVQNLTYSKDYAHSIFGAVRQWINWLAERGLIPLPPNIRSKRFKFKNGGGKKVVTFTDAEVKGLLTACDDFSERTRLYLLLGLNCGMLQNDISELEDTEVDLNAGTLTRPRSKTPNGPTVTYKLWPETLALLKKYRASGQVPGQRGGNLLLLTERGAPLVKYWLEAGKQRRYDIIQSAWSRLMERVDFKKPFKILRKTSATKLGDHPQYKFYVGYFLGHSPRSVAEKNYLKPSDREFFEACEWLRRALLGSAGG